MNSLLNTCHAYRQISLASNCLLLGSDKSLEFLTGVWFCLISGRFDSVSPVCESVLQGMLRQFPGGAYCDPTTESQLSQSTLVRSLFTTSCKVNDLVRTQAVSKLLSEAANHFVNFTMYEMDGKDEILLGLPPL